MTPRLPVWLGLIVALAMGMAAPRTQTRADVPAALRDRAQRGGEIGVIVAVAGPFVPEADLRGAAAVARQRASIRQTVADVMGRAAAVGVTVGAGFDALPYFTARVTRGSLEVLATTAGVARISEDRKLSPTLSVSPGLINAPPAWAAGYTGAGWSVAVLDTGVDTTHPFLGGRVASQACYSNALGLGDDSTSSVCPNGVNSDFSGGGPCPAGVDGCSHGTHVAGIVAGAGGGAGGSGIAPAAFIHAVQVFSRQESDCAFASPCAVAYTSDIIRGLQHVLTLRGQGQPIAAVNLSLGADLFPGANCDGATADIDATKAAIDELRAAGVATIVAAGNDAVGGAIAAPACISSAIAVGATTRGVCPDAAECPSGAATGLPNVPIFSNHSIAVDLLAPGVDIVSSVPGGGFAAFDGTSMATPHVAGAWAVLKQAAPAASPLEIANALAVTGTPITEPFTGIATPLVDLDAARRRLLGDGGGGGGGGGGGSGSGPPGAPTGFAVVIDGRALTMSWTAPAVADGAVPDGAATSYRLIARVSSGGAPVVVLPLGDVTSFALTAPDGTFFLSVQALNAAGAGPESNVVPVVVPSLPPRPGAPGPLLVEVTGNAATFTWDAPSSGGPVHSYVVRAGRTPSPAPAQASFQLPPAQTRFSIAGIPPGTWFVSVLAQNTGGPSVASNEVQLSIAAPQPPGPPTLHPPTVTPGNTVTVSWTPGAGGTPSSYTLIARSSPAGPVIAQFALSATTVTFGGVPGGTYYLQVLAHNAVGSSGFSNQVTLVVP